MKISLGAKTILYPAPVLVVGTYDAAGKPNVMTAAWGGICCSQPPCVAVSLREATYTYQNLMQQKAFTLSLPSEDQVKVADFFGIVSGKNTDKFKVSGLTPVKSELVNAPYPQEFALVLECKLIHTFKFGLHTQFVGEILDVKANSEVLGPDGSVDLEKLRPICFGLSPAGYHALGRNLGKAFVTKAENLNRTSHG